jgi:teichuronic acid biosynthesis glycosyltransferase TuaG
MNKMVSVITTSYNVEDFIGQTIKSILVQNYKNLEHIIVDDGSTDNTVKVIKAFNDSRVRLIESGHVGRGKALNVAIQESKGKYIAIQDADDLSHPNRLSMEVGCLEMKEDIYILGTSEIVFRGSELIDWEETAPHGDSNMDIKDVTGLLVYYNPISHTSVIMQRNLLEKIGGYSESRKNLFDWDLYIRVAASGYRIFKLSIPLVGKRLHENQFFESRKRLTYIYHSLKLQIQAAAISKKSPLFLISLPILFAYRLLPVEIRIAARRHLRLTA